jgi:serine/threonine protein kinase
MSLGGKKLISIGNYSLDGVALGEGSFGKVELATHSLLNTKVAAKVVVRSTITDPYVERNIHREATLLLSIKHPNIVRMIEVILSREIYCLIIEYVAGGTLLDKLQVIGHFCERDAKIIGGQLIGALAYLHSKQILHRDLKLENIMLGGGHRVVLIDFGLSNYWNPGHKMTTYCGSAEYAAPELFKREPHYGPAIDVWSFGGTYLSRFLSKLQILF